ncbi:MAG: TldD/PmbA family protein [bacterium]
MDCDQRRKLAEWVMNCTLQMGADEVGVDLVKAEELDIEFRDNKIDKLEQGIQNLLYIEMYKDNRYSIHKSNLLTREFLKDFIGKALHSTSYLEEDKYRSLPNKELYPQKDTYNLEIYDTQFSRIDKNDKISLVSQIERASLSSDDQVISVTTSFSEGCFHLIKMQSNGFKNEKHSTNYTIGSEVTAKDNNNNLVEDSFYAHVRFFNDLPTPEQIGREAADRCLKKIGQGKISSGIYTMVVENREAGMLVAMILSAIKGSKLFLRSSFLEGMRGRRIASKKLTIIDDPFVKKGLKSSYFDAEGCATQRRIIVESGILKEHYIDTYYSKKLKIKQTSGNRTNILLHYGKSSYQELISKTGTGIFVTEFIGGNFNSTTGDFSFGIAGFLFEKGKIVRPVNEMNITGNALRLWNNLIEVGNDPFPYSSVQTPTLVFKEVFFSGD